MNNILLNRINIFKRFIIISFFIIIIFLIKIILLDGSLYKDKYERIINASYLYKDAPRGRIYDRNHKLLVDNKLVAVLCYFKPNNIDSKELIDLAYKLSSLIEFDYSKLTDRNIKEFYLLLNDLDYLITDIEWNKYYNREISYNDIYELKINRIDDSMINNISIEDKKAAYIYYLLNNGYYYDIKIIKKDNFSDKEIAIILDNLEYLPGIFIDYTYEREYLYGDTFRSILGNVSNILYEDKAYYISRGYSLSDMVGTSYIEKQYEEYLCGEKGRYKIENGNIIDISSSSRGKDIILTIDIELQKKIDDILDQELINAKSEPNTSLFNSIYVVIKDPKNGDILAMSGRGIRKVNDKYVTYDLAVGTLVNSITPGSVVKGASMLVGYKENAISIGEEFIDDCIKIYSYPKKCSWKRLGKVNDITALSLSSNVFQFKTAFKVANFDYYYNSKLIDVSNAFAKYRAFFNELGLGVKSGIDLPIDGIGNIGKSNSPDLYLNYVIGQYDTYTVMQLSEYISTIANYGKRVYPHLLMEVRDNDNLYFKYVPEEYNISVDKKYIDRVRNGFREVMISGLGRNFMGDVLNPAGKTGTSESFCDSDYDGIIDASTVSNAFVGYYPSENPKMSIAIVFPNIMVITGKDEYRSYANKRITKKIVELFDNIY